ncbi:hypothetical protein PGTUg99_009932 [Puccinia graminis f. sp. tritici]|uniref:Uncharacterized protein n=1 Tax=Puccinia graminis f. sp. tritici TaxID=56615 RepID=A0A5B0RUK7_PUCGR|nr:hypothetical protein PGTUg99_009932 [Puccinia graminis f. sp. tritici]
MGNLSFSVSEPFHGPFTFFNYIPDYLHQPGSGYPSFNSSLLSTLFPTSTIRLSTNILDDLPDDLLGNLLGYGILKLVTCRAAILVTGPSLFDRPVFDDLLIFVALDPVVCSLKNHRPLCVVLQSLFPSIAKRSLSILLHRRRFRPGSIFSQERSHRSGPIPFLVQSCYPPLSQLLDDLLAFAGPVVYSLKNSSRAQPTSSPINLSSLLAPLIHQYPRQKRNRNQSPALTRVFAASEPL